MTEEKLMKSKKLKDAIDEYVNGIKAGTLRLVYWDTYGNEHYVFLRNKEYKEIKEILSDGLEELRKAFEEL